MVRGAFGSDEGADDDARVEDDQGEKDRLYVPGRPEPLSRRRRSLAQAATSSSSGALLGLPWGLLASAVDGRERQLVGLLLGQSGLADAQDLGVARDLVEQGLKEPHGVGPHRVGKLLRRPPLALCAFPSHTSDHLTTIVARRERGRGEAPAFSPGTRAWRSPGLLPAGAS